MQENEKALITKPGYIWATHVVEIVDDKCPLIEG